MASDCGLTARTLKIPGSSVIVPFLKPTLAQVKFEPSPAMKKGGRGCSNARQRPRRSKCRPPDRRGDGSRRWLTVGWSVAVRVWS